MKGSIKEYLDGQAKKDPALNARYKAEMLEKCVDYINSLARKTLGGQNGHIDDAVVYKWARDYFVEGIAEKQKDENPKSKKENEKPQKTATGKKEDSAPKPAASKKESAQKTVAENPRNPKASGSLKTKPPAVRGGETRAAQGLLFA